MEFDQFCSLALPNLCVFSADIKKFSITLESLQFFLQIGADAKFEVSDCHGELRKGHLKDLEKSWWKNYKVCGNPDICIELYIACKPKSKPT